MSPRAQITRQRRLSPCCFVRTPLYGAQNRIFEGVQVLILHSPQALSLSSCRTVLDKTAV
jgi:hypothetical protein